MTTTDTDLSRGQASLDLAARRAPIALAICGAISIWVDPSIWLHGELKETRKAVQANAVSVAVNAEAIEANAKAIARGRPAWAGWRPIWTDWRRSWIS